jgi:hypothetical protein
MRWTASAAPTRSLRRSPRSRSRQFPRTSRDFFERLWWWDQVVFDTSRQPGVGEDLLNLQVSLRLDGLAVQGIASLKPLPQ